MRIKLPSLVLGTFVTAAGIGIAAAADPFLGVWNLNLAKSQLGPGPGAKSVTRIYTVVGDAFDMQINGVALDGKPFSRHSVFRLDGKDYAITDLGDFDTMTTQRVDDYHYAMTMKKGGKVVTSSTVSISADGKVFTQVLKGVDAKGAPTSPTAVFDKQ